MATLSNETFYQKKYRIRSGRLYLIAGSDLSKKFEGSKEVVGENWSPAEEEDCHDQDQHVDHLDEDCHDHHLTARDTKEVKSFLLPSVYRR